ncbi:hypothetical protein BFW38_15215 [Terasakiispira papahanaumokuakeensis]|uniref:Chloride channel protein n=1 Tax=Terasakiispira papahanaumokuakeensis TaxID=197479 RepID=A0A1E2VCJ0_9GAMM|nr:chloride channel protein [Terasakiispira papahanaumokuakeensis]ODC04674.1 hypothetical protein BFW38_15215 [Terasakiispira papahanaumokuakeensis]
MTYFKILRKWLSLEHFRHQLARVDALPQLAILGLMAGLVTGSTMLVLRWLIEGPALLLMPNGLAENFEALPWSVRLLLPIGTGLAIGLLLTWLKPTTRKAGIGYVIERLALHQGHLPMRNSLVQLVTGVTAIIGGLSAGREGPAVHIGAGASSWLGRRLRLPNNSIRLLVGSGTAAAIAASFNTPLAGVIFAMEVVLLEYTIAGFTPVILAAFSAAALNQVFYGSSPAFDVPPLGLHSLLELGWIMLMGVVIGTLSASFVMIARRVQSLPLPSLWLRGLLAGILTGVAGCFLPEVMGIGYDSLDQILNGQMLFGMMLALSLSKLILTAVTAGLGLPIGIIGPILVVGAAFGGAFGVLGDGLLSVKAADSSLYAMLGMAAMMGAVLQAPLAALMALLEMTHNTQIVLPSMLVVIVAEMMHSALFRRPSYFIAMLNGQGIYPRQQPLAQALSRVSVAAIMDRNVLRAPRVINTEKGEKLLQQRPQWIALEQQEGQKSERIILPAAALARWLDEHHDPEEKLDLLEIPAARLLASPIHLEATLQEADEEMRQYGVEALYVRHMHAPTLHRISGIITREQIETHYR